MKTTRGERDYAYGAVMLTLRTKIGLTQTKLADRLGIARLAVCRWEAGSAYPKPEHLKALIALAVQYQAFPTGSEAEEIRQLWKIAHQKVLIDEDWLGTLFVQRNSPQEREAEIVQISDTRQEIGTVPVFLHSTDPASSARSVPRSNLPPLLTPVPPVEGSTVTARPQRLEAETIGTPVPTGEMGTVQGEGAVQGTIEALGAEPNPQGGKTRGRRKRLLALVLLLVILTIIGLTGTFFFQARLGATGQVNKTATVQAYPGYLTGNGTLAFFDPLSREAGSEWSSYSNESIGEFCQFTRGAYHVSQLPNGYIANCSTRRAFSNFAFEVLSTITQGDCGGVFFRNDSNMRFYKLVICQDSAYDDTRPLATQAKALAHYAEGPWMADLASPCSY